MMIRKTIAFLVCILLSNLTLAQKLPNIDSIAIKLGENYSGLGWEISKKSDSVLILSYNKTLEFVSTNVRRQDIVDSIHYKLFIIFRKEKNKLKEYKTHLKQFVEKVKAYSNKNPFFCLESSPKEGWGSFLPFKIPPVIFFSNYSIIIFDNAPPSVNLAIKPEVQGLRVSEDVWGVIRFLSEEGIFCSYKKIISPWVEDHFNGYFNLIYWGEIKKVIYSKLFND